ncbi:MAG: hypothetical protein V2B20_25315 [Pseudomonadota bacterium]
MAGEIGVDIFRTHIGGGPEEEIIQLDEERRSCDQLWRTIVLNSDGGIAPCFYLYFKDDDFAHISCFENTNQRYLEARKMFNRLAAGELATDLQHPCLKCNVVHGQKHLAAYLTANPYAIKGHRTGGP